MRIVTVILRANLAIDFDHDCCFITYLRPFCDARNRSEDEIRSMMVKWYAYLLNLNK